MTDHDECHSTDALHMSEAKHVCCVYESEEEQFSQALPILKEGLENNSKCIVSFSETRNANFLDHARRRGVNVDEYLANDQLLTVPAADFFLEDGALNADNVRTRSHAAIDAAVDQGWTTLTVLSDFSDLLERAELEDWLELELGADHTAKDKPCYLACMYDASSISGKVLRTMIEAHPVIGMGNYFAWSPFYTEPPAEAA